MAATVRKEISKDDYKFFIGRVEKISNGQVAFIADTQKKAVELLGEKIPQNVIDAANNYKAFNIWLGNAVNPIIVSDSGYKEEIRVFGDGYDFFEVKAETKPDKNNPKAGGNAAEDSEVSPSIEKIFVAVTTEIKPHIIGKYFVQIDDNWYQQSVRESFKTLEDAVKIARIMHSELRKVSRHIYATVEARTVDINKTWIRSDDWSTFFEIDNYDNEKVLRRETVDAIAKIDNRTVEEVRNDIGGSGDNYRIYKNSAAEVEKLIAEVDAVNAEIAAKLEAEEINTIDDYIIDVDAAAEVEERNAIENYFIESEQWSKESNEILEKTVYAALQNGNSIKLFKQGCTNLEDCIELIDCYTLTKKDAEEKTFCSDMYEEGGEVTFTPVSPKGVSYSLADYKDKEQFQAVATKLAEAIQRSDKQFIFPTIEEINGAAAEPKLFEVGKWYYDCCVGSDNSPAYKVTRRTKKMVTLTDTFGESIRRKIETTFDVEEITLNGEIMPTFLKADCFCINIAEIKKAEDDLAYSLAQDAEDDVEEVEDDSDDTAEVEEIVTPAEEKNPLKEKIADLKAAEKIISEKYLSLCRSLYVKVDGEYQSAVGFDDYVTKYHDTFYCREGDDYVEDTAAYYELKEIEREWNALFKELEYFENIEEKAKILKAKIAEQKNSRKSVIDWKATFEDMKISEILNLQKDLKKFLKLGQIDLAENVFSMLKTLCKNYREQLAA